MWDLEYLLLFGLPNNKLELLDGITPLTFPFADRATAQSHFQQWKKQLAQWRDIQSPIQETKATDYVEADVGGATLQLYRHPIRLAMPMAHEAWDWLRSSFWQRDLWEGQPAGFESGMENSQRHWETKHHLWAAIKDATEGRKATHCGGVDLMLSDSTAVAPDHCYYQRPRGKWMIGGDFYAGPPDLVAEILSPSSRSIDRGIRKDLYAKAGVPRLWLLDPLTQLVELHELSGRTYTLVATHCPGERFKSDLFPNFEFSVDELFESQWPRSDDGRNEANEVIPKWFMPADLRLGLEYLFLCGHPERRYEIWENQAPCMLAFGSEEESKLRFTHFLEDAGRWESLPVPIPTIIEPGTESARVGRFHLVRRGQHVRLHVAVDGRKFQSLLETSSSREGWDWGEEDKPKSRANV